MSSFSRVMDTLTAPINSLTEQQFADRVVMEIVKVVNKERKSAGVPPLHMDEYCNKAANDIASRIGQLSQVVANFGVVGCEFSMINSEKTHQLPTMAQNETVLSAYLDQLKMLDMSSHRSLVNPQFTHCGFAVKRVYGSFKIHGLLFRKSLCVYHVSFEVNEGIKIRGKMLDRNFAPVAVVVNEALNPTTKPSVAGPSRFKVHPDNSEFEVNIPRLVLSSRSVSEKELEFYVTSDNPRNISYGKAPDIKEVDPAFTLAHKMSFQGLWESNVMIEERSPGDSQFIQNEHESKNSTRLMEFDMSGPRRGVATRGRGRGATTARVNQWGASRDTPFKATHLGLSRRPGASQPSSWGAPQEPVYGENVPPSDVEMGAAAEQAGFFQQPSATPPAFSSAQPSFPGAQPSFPSTQSSFPSAQPSFPTSTPSFHSQFPSFPPPAQTPAPAPVFQFPAQNPFSAPPQPQFPAFQPPPQPQVFPTAPSFQPIYQQPGAFQNPLPSPSEFVFQQMQPPVGGVQLMIPCGVAAPNFFGRPASESVFGTAGSHSSLGNTLPTTKSQKSAQTCTEDSDLETHETLVRDDDSVTIPCLLLPLPIKLFEQVRRIRQENEGTRSLWTSMDYSDVILKLKECELKGHRGVLSSGSPFFKDHLEKVKAFGSAPVAKLVMPQWVAEKPMRLVLMFLYSCDVDREGMDLPLAREVLALADFLGVHELVVAVVVKHVVLKLTKEDVLGVMKGSFQRGSEQTKEAWSFLCDYCAHFAAENIAWLLRNRKSEFQGVPLPLLYKTVETALANCAASETIAMLITLLIEASLAQDIFELCNKVSGLSLLGYSDSLVDIRMVDLLRPYEAEHFEKLPPDQVMEFATFKEADLHFQTAARSAPVPPPALGELNSCSVPVDAQPSDPKSIGYKQTFKTLPLVQPTELRPSRKKPNFSFSLSELSRPRTVVSPVFRTQLRSWFLTVVLGEEAISVFLCERGQGIRDGPGELLYTSVVCEVAIETAVHSQSLVFFYCYPNGHSHCAGERNACKLSKLGDCTKVTLHASLREFPTHSAILHYIAERFDTFNDQKYRHFKPLSFYDFHSLLVHDALKVKDERPCVSALWKYAATKESTVINFVIPAIRFQFLSVEDLCSMTRDHVIIRQCANFRHLFEQEFYRRIKAGPVTDKPRNSYAAKVHVLTSINHCDALLKWLLTANHHEGYDRKLELEQKKIQEERAEFEKKRAELNARKHELFLENEKLHGEVKRIRKDYGEQSWGEELPSHARDYSEMRTPLSERDTNYRQNECRLM